MKCFVHPNEEAICVCKKCGKAMCQRCSAYSQHSGICPECKKKELEYSRICLLEEARSLKWGAIGALCLTVLTCWTVIGLFVFGIISLVKFKNRKNIQDEIAFISNEIKKLDNATKFRSTDTSI